MNLGDHVKIHLQKTCYTLDFTLAEKNQPTSRANVDKLEHSLSQLPSSQMASLAQLSCLSRKKAAPDAGVAPPAHKRAGTLICSARPELEALPTGWYRWVLLLVVLQAWTAEQYEVFMLGPVLNFLLLDFRITIVEYGNAQVFVKLIGIAGAWLSAS